MINDHSKNKTYQAVLAITFGQTLPYIPQIKTEKHCRIVVKNDQHIAIVFPLPPLNAYRRPPNIRTKLIRPKIPENRAREQRNLPVMNKCQRNCAICPYIAQGKTIK